MRIPIKDLPGSRFGYFDSDGGTLGRGTASHYDVPTLTTLSSRIAIEITEKALKTTDGEPKAIRKLLLLEVKNAMKEMRRQLNAQLQTAGNGVIATITDKTTGAGGSVTVKTTPFYYQLLREGQIVQVYDATITTNRGSFTIATIDKAASVVNATAASTVPAGTIATDVLLPEGLSGANPLAYFGFPYHISDAATGTWLTLNRATVPAIRSNHVNASGNALTTAPIRLLLRKIIQRVGKVNVKAIKAHTHGTQVSAYEELAILVSKIEKGSGNEAVDMLFGDTKFAGVEVQEDIHAARDRIDFWLPESWGRAETAPVDFLKEPNGNYFYRPFDSTTGSPIASILFYIEWFGQIFSDNPSAQGLVDNLAILPGYDSL